MSRPWITRCLWFLGHTRATRCKFGSVVKIRQAFFKKKRGWLALLRLKAQPWKTTVCTGKPILRSSSRRNSNSGMPQPWQRCGHSKYTRPPCRATWHITLTTFFTSLRLCNRCLRNRFLWKRLRWFRFCIEVHGVHGALTQTLLGLQRRASFMQALPAFCLLKSKSRSLWSSVWHGDLVVDTLPSSCSQGCSKVPTGPHAPQQKSPSLWNPQKKSRSFRKSAQKFQNLPKCRKARGYQMPAQQSLAKRSPTQMWHWLKKENLHFRGCCRWTSLRCYYPTWLSGSKLCACTFLWALSKTALLCVSYSGRLRTKTHPSCSPSADLRQGNGNDTIELPSRHSAQTEITWEVQKDSKPSDNSLLHIFNNIVRTRNRRLLW